MCGTLRRSFRSLKKLDSSFREPAPYLIRGPQLYCPREGIQWSSPEPCNLAGSNAALRRGWHLNCEFVICTSCSSSLSLPRKLRICCCSNSLKHFFP
jgi:hypothetical protein